MSSQPPIQGCHIRIARPTNDVSALLPFYIDGLGFSIIGEFKDHNGFDGLMLGLEGMNYHLEFTRKHDHHVDPAPSEDNLLVFYIPDKENWEATVTRMKKAGIQSVKSFNPYWDVKGKTYEDADRYRIVLQNAGWENKKIEGTK